MELKSIIEQRFHKIKNEKIALYISEVDGAEAVKAFEDFKIQGVMDAYPMVKEAYGKRLLSFEDACREDVEDIIIVTMEGNYEIVRKRIAGFCRENHVKLYNIAGERLYVGLPYHKKEAHACFHVSKAELETKIDRSECIFFQLKDTLCVSLFWDEADIDVILQNKNTEQRKEAVKKSFVVRQEMVQAIQYAQEIKKEIILLNDTGYEDEILQYILNKIGMENLEVLQCKEEKNWPVLCMERIAGRDALFVGNSQMEEILPKEKPIHVFRIYSCIEMLRASVYASLLEQETTPYDRIKIMLFAYRLFQSPYKLFVSDGLGHVSGADDIAYLFAAPYVIDFMQWFLKEIQREEIEYVMLSARDGYLLNKLYSEFLKYGMQSKYPKASYFYTSRMSMLLAGYETEADIVKAAKQPFLGGMEDMLMNRYAVLEENVELYDYASMEDKEKYLLRHKDWILEASKHVRENYISYIKPKQWKQYKKIAFFDFAASGSCQLSMEKIIGKKLLGMYFCRLDTEERSKMELNIKSCYRDDYNLIANMLFFELIFSSPEPNFRNIDDTGSAQFCRETRSPEQISYCIELQDGVEEYCRQWYEMVGEDFLTMEKKLNNDWFLDFLYKDYTVIENDIFHNYIQEDNYDFSCSNLGNLYRY